MTESNRIQIFDTTLRDGEQSPGATMNTEEKLVIARQLEKLGVDVIEAGFAAASKGDFEAIQRVAAAVHAPIVLSLARTREGDIDRALAAVEGAARPGIHTFIATSDIHLEHKLMMSRQEVLDAAVWAVERAKEHVDYVEFSAEDASRSDPDFLVEIFGAVIEAGASTLNVPDTTGYAIPTAFGDLFRKLIAETPGADRVIWSAHCHNDLGLAVANSLAAVAAGARQVECTVNGIGERAGNTSLEEVVMALHTRRDLFGIDCGVVTEQIFPSSRLLSQITGIPIPAYKPIVGVNAFAHEAGIHQDGVLKYKLTYEIMQPETVGLSSNRIVLGKHSGRHAFVDRLEQLGVERGQIDMVKAFERFKALADRKKNIYDEDLLAIANEQATRVPERYEIVDLSARSSTGETPYAAVTLKIDGDERRAEATGDGMVDAAYKAIKQIAGDDVILERYNVKAITGGTDAQGEVSCLVRREGTTVSGVGQHTDIVMASVLAFVNALNKLEQREQNQARLRDVGP